MTFYGCKPQEEIVPEEEHTAVFGMWFSYLDFEESMQYLTLEEFQANAETVINNCKDLGVNTLYLHAVSFTDAFYDSKILPRAKSLPDIDYDPLRIFIDLAHQKQIHVEAWINPLRSFKVEEVESALPETSPLYEWYKYNDERYRRVGERYYLNPAYPEVRDFVCSYVKEIIENYEVDGIHMDDYFYPEGTEYYFDAYIYGEENYKNPIDLGDFRRNANNELVKAIHDTIKQYNPELTYGISVAGNYENDLNIYFADPSAWMEAKTIDYLIPQVYWGYEHPIKPYERTLSEWRALSNNTNIPVYAGLAAYKVGTEDLYANNSLEWIENTDLLAQQINTAFALDCPGVAFFRYNSLFKPSDEVKGNVEKEIINIKNTISQLQGLSE